MIRFMSRLVVALVVDSFCRPPKRMRYKPTVFMPATTLSIADTMTYTAWSPGWKTTHTGPATVSFSAKEG